MLDGHFNVQVKSRRVDYRVSLTPAVHGMKLVLRVLDPANAPSRLHELGMLPWMYEKLRTVCNRDAGLVLACGPTGSGKTTTLYSCLREIDLEQRNAITIEDPVEYQIQGATQIPIDSKQGHTFGGLLRSILRQDPDVILVGEIRDQETAEIAMQAALTGHFVFTTLHANDTATTVTRLLDIGIEVSLIQSAVTAVLAQRLVRVLCPKCKEAYPAPEDFRKKLGVPPDKELMIYREKGCAACLNTGFRGRSGVHELLIFNDDIKELLVGHPSVQAIRAAGRRHGMRTLQEGGLAKVLQGVTSLSEVARMTK
jgi:general secretion pathway protein E